MAGMIVVAPFLLAWLRDPKRIDGGRDRASYTEVSAFAAALLRLSPSCLRWPRRSPIWRGC